MKRYGYLTIHSDDFCPIFIGNPIFWIQETDNSNGVPILCQIAFSWLSFPFFVRLKLFNGLVRNLDLECAWRQSYHSIKRIINTAFLSQRGHGRVRRSVERLKPGQFVKGNQRTRHVDISTIQYSHTWTPHLFLYLRDWNWNRVICQGRRISFEYLKFCRVFPTVLLVF